MSDLSTTLQALERTRSQLPVSSYFDAALFEREKALLFDSGPRYVGHALQVPQPGRYQTLAHEGEGRALIHTPDGIELVSNVCRHRQAVMLKGAGDLGSGPSEPRIVCPLHRWTYSAQGQLLAAPHFDTQPCLNLQRYPLDNIGGLLFERNGCDVRGDLGPLLQHPAFSFDGYVLDRVEQHRCPYNWKTFIEVYLEDYHVGPFHPGLGHFVTCDDLAWQLLPNASLQTVGLHRSLVQPGSAVYTRWHDQVLAAQSAGLPLLGPQPAPGLPDIGAVWLTYYPHIMLEWYPGTLVVSTLHPIGPRETLNTVAFFYPEEIAAFEREFVEAQQAAYMETCIEDDEIAERMDAGRQALFERGDDEAGPYQQPMERGMEHFHQWYRRRLWPQQHSA
ncbi:aromatic ring-hydroxylating oxygenase subunit alpha [Amphibiibacter pelophylacis]|uniref:Aromatic ring-hydroxylating dioxygenase subunit alpha n=1 Tax=Amphibiibacter pelophylacis TaxID=1799477 RepID=A0ACC6P0M2_9BURK